MLRMGIGKIKIGIKQAIFASDEGGGQDVPSTKDILKYI